MTRIRVAGALVEVPDGWSVRVDQDGTVELVPGAAEVAPTPVVEVRTRETVATREMHYSGTLAHQPIVWGLSQPAQTSLQLTRDPPRLPPPVPQIRFTYKDADERYTHLVPLVWEIVTPQGGWWRPKVVAHRLGVPLPSRNTEPGGYVAEYARICYVLERMGKEGHLMTRMPGKLQGPRARRHYAEPRWAAEHPDDRPVV